MEEISATLKHLKNAGMAVSTILPIISPFNTSFWPLEKSEVSWRMRIDNELIVSSSSLTCSCHSRYDIFC